MYCVCCGKKLGLISYNQVDEIEQIWKDERSINKQMVDNGIIQIIDAGYGSKHDGDQFIIAICDDCVYEKLKDHTVLYYNNYMYGKDFAEKEIESSKKGYRRRRNLDDLLE